MSRAKMSIIKLRDREFFMSGKLARPVTLSFRKAPPVEPMLISPTAPHSPAPDPRTALVVRYRIGALTTPLT